MSAVSGPHANSPGGRYLFTLCLVTLGVVYGDIGTSPLYAIRECFHGPHAVPPTETHVLGVLSLIFWALVIVISIKYLMVVLRADNQGEGGILSLTALATAIKPTGRNERPALVLIGLFGAALLYGDGVVAVLGLLQVVRDPTVLRAVDPAHGGRFFAETGWEGYLVLGSVFLAVTGGEALYADMGHFGTKPIRLDWFVVVLP